MNILLIYPQFPDNHWWSFKHVLKFVRQKSLLPPLGLLTVAAILPPEWPKRLVDMGVREITEEDLAWADYAFIGAMLAQRESAGQVVSQCKQAGVRVVAGGPLFTSEYEQFKEIDHFVLNEAEVTLPPFLEDLEEGCAKRVYTTSDFANMEEIPIPLWELADLSQYNVASIQFSRGCPYDCEFCNVTTLLGHKSRHKTVAQIIAELDNLYYDQRWRGGVFFADDNLIGNKKYFKDELLPALVEWQKDKGNIPFNTQASINLADDEELMQMMHEAGFDIVLIGIETPDENTLAACTKSQNRNRDLVEDVRRIQRAGIEVQGSFIVGFDSDTPSIFQRQIDFIQESGIAHATVNLLQAWPGTKLFTRLKMEARLIDESCGDSVCAETNIITVMDSEILREGYIRVLQYIYSPSPYYQRVKTFLKNYKTPKVRPPLKFDHVIALFRSVFLLGVQDRGRAHYWGLLLWMSLYRPSLFSRGLLLSLHGYHFRRVCEDHIFPRKGQEIS